MNVTSTSCDIKIFTLSHPNTLLEVIKTIVSGTRVCEDIYGHCVKHRTMWKIYLDSIFANRGIARIFVNV